MKMVTYKGVGEKGDKRQIRIKNHQLYLLYVNILHV